MVSATPGSMLVSMPAHNKMQSSAGVWFGHTRGSQTGLLSEINGGTGRNQVGDSAKQSKDYIWFGHRMCDSARDTKLCTLSQPIRFVIPGSTHEGFMVRLDGVFSGIPAGDDLCPICRGVADLFTNVDGGLGDCLGAWSSSHVGCYGTMLLQRTRDPDNVRGVCAK